MMRESLLRFIVATVKILPTAIKHDNLFLTSGKIDFVEHYDYKV